MLTKRNIARIAFWCVLAIELLFIQGVITALVDPSVESGVGVLFLVLSLIFGIGTYFLYRLYDPFKETYHFVSETPLRFHKLFCYVLIPLGILHAVYRIFIIFSAVDFPSNKLYLIDLLNWFLHLTLVCLCVIGLRKWKSYAWRALMIVYLLDILYGIIVAIVSRFNSFLFSSALASVTGYTYSAMMVCLYYYKRKNLFFSPNVVSNAGETELFSVGSDPIEWDKFVGRSISADTPRTVEEAAPMATNIPVISFCRICGCKLADGSNFCSHCGTPVLKER